MAVDHALAESVGRGDSTPILRLYAWAPAAVSVGYAQPVAHLRGRLDALRRRGYALVRRPTGGSAVLHDDEVTYATVLPARGGRGARETCARIHDALRLALQRLGVTDLALAGAAARRAQGGWAERPGTTATLEGPIVRGGGVAVRAREGRPRSGVCFAEPAASEVTWQRRKVVGSAQRRLTGALLQHGAVPLEDRQHVLADVWPGQPPDAASVRRAAGRRVPRAEVVAAIVSAFGQAFGVDFVGSGLTAAEDGRARELAAACYGSDAFLYRL